MPIINIKERDAEDKAKKYRSISLVLTKKCNLKCRYCYEKEELRDDKIMDFSVAKNAISKYMRESETYDGVAFDFFGGEPLLAFPLIKEIIEWFQTVKWDKDCKFLIGTNGTLLNDEKKEWLYKYKNFVIPALSIDGTKKAHDINRSNSYDLVSPHISFFKNWPHQPAKMTISAETIPYVAESIIELEEMGLLFTANIGFEDIWRAGDEKQRLLGIYEDQLNRLVDYYAERPNVYPVSQILNAFPEYLGLPDYGESKKEEIKRFCGAGHEMAVVDVDGNIYPCHRFIPWITGHPAPNVPANCQTIWNPDKCSKCKLVLSCPTCAGFNWEINQDTGIRTTFHCESYKLEVLASAKLEKIKLKSRYNDLAKLPLKEQIQIKKRLEALMDLIDNGI